MYISSLSIKNLKRLRNLPLQFTHEDGSPRMWTVLIGENGTGKTTVLQAIALAAAGKLLVNDLAGNTVAHLVDRRRKESLEIHARFTFTDNSIADPKLHQLLDGPPTHGLQLSSRVSLSPKETSLRGDAWYGESEKPPANNKDPLVNARARESHLWFVIGYGVHRTLPTSGRMPDLVRPSVDRMKSLFDLEHPITSTSFISHYGNRQAKARIYSNVLKRTIISTGVLPADITNLELRGYGGVTMAADLLKRDRFHQKMGDSAVKVPAIALAHGYQSTVAWIADLVGHILLEANTEISPDDFEGLVLIDEIDLYLHPTWQARLIPALRKTFPKLQFVATTHSPVVLSTLAPEEVVWLQSDPVTGDVGRVTPDQETDIDPDEENDETVKDEPHGSRQTRPKSDDQPISNEIPAPPYDQPDPRAMTATEMYREYFGLDRLTLNEHGEELRSYTALATNPYRNDYQQKKMKALFESLTNALISDLVKPVPRSKDD